MYNFCETGNIVSTSQMKLSGKAISNEENQSGAEINHTITCSNPAVPHAKTLLMSNWRTETEENNTSDEAAFLFLS